MPGLAVSEGTGPGLFGKLPSRGDFVVRRLDPACRTAVDEWLQSCMLTSQRAMGEAWLRTYLNAPVWRFACAAGLCGAAPLAGVMMPSVDRVGRYFPLVLAAQLPGPDPGQRLLAATAWYDALEAQALRALETDTDLNALDRAVDAIGLPPDPSGEAAGDAPASSLFWLPSDTAAPAVLLHMQGLPTPQSFSSLLSQHWPSGGWQPVPGQGGTQRFVLPPPARLIYAGRTHAGTRRALNQDALLMRPDIAVWAVADGVGGHEAGEVASRVVVDHLERLLPPLGVTAMLDDVEAMLGDANAALCSRAGTIRDDAIVASTVAVLTLLDGHAGVVWSGDSRVYRLRGGHLTCVTRDHAEAGTVRHAVGSAPELVTERAVAAAWPDDRYLLCSDGLTKALSEAEITAHLALPTAEDAVAALMDDSLVAGARDNVTAIVVHLPRT